MESFLYYIITPVTNIMTYVCKALVFHIMQRNRDLESQREKNKTDRDHLSL